MTDRELLEMAAKAAGMGELVFHSEEERYSVVITPLGGRANTWHFWDPLEEDDDALRLAVDLRIDVYPWISEEDPTSSAMARNSHGFRAIEFASKNGGCRYAATRRAITRAAAEIGRAME